jgi:hypothetical protein
MPGGEERRQPISMPGSPGPEDRLPAAWQEFIRYCRELKFGDIERLSIQDGVPVLAEVVRKKVRFPRDK